MGLIPSVAGALYYCLSVEYPPQARDWFPDCAARWEQVPRMGLLRGLESLAGMLAARLKPLRAH